MEAFRQQNRPHERGLSATFLWVFTSEIVLLKQASDVQFSNDAINIFLSTLRFVCDEEKGPKNEVIQYSKCFESEDDA